MGVFESITHKEEIEEIYAEAESIQDRAIQRFNNAKSSAETKLEEFGKLKIQVFGDKISTFCNAFKSFKNVEVAQLSYGYEKIYQIENPQELALIEEDVKYSKDLLKIGLVSVGAGTLTTVAAFGGVHLLGGVAAGGKISALAAKGVGVKVAALSSFAFVPVLIVFSVLAGIKGKERLKKAKSDLAKVKAEAKKIDIHSRVFEEINNVLDNYTTFVLKIGKVYTKITDRISKIASSYPKDDNGKIDFDSLLPKEQETLHLSWLMTQLYYGVLKQPLLNESGKAEKESETVLVELKGQYDRLEKDYSNNDAEIAKLFKTYRSEVLDTTKKKAYFVFSLVLLTVFIVLSIVSFCYNRLQLVIVFAALSLISIPYDLFIKKVSSDLIIKIRVAFIAFLMIALMIYLIMGNNLFYEK